MYEQITTNLKPVVRHETMEGREYLVVPMVMLTEGVHAGSKGPIYYPPEELGKTPVVWNHKPIVVYHPEINGQGVSACSPDILTSRKVGVIMNTQWKGKLRSEAWLEKDRLRVVDNRVLDAITNGRMVEVSTGLFSDNEEKTGEWNGEAYTAIARNYRPDHLAILPDQKGACSIADGAGLLQTNADASLQNQLQEIQKTLEVLGTFVGTQNKESKQMEREKMVGELIANGNPWTEADRAFLMAAPEGAVISMYDQLKAAKTPEVPAAPAPVANTDAEAEWLAEAPASIQLLVRNAKQRDAEDTARLVGVITANKSNVFTAAQLQAMPLDQLRGLAALAGSPAPTANFAGAAGPAPVLPTTNAPKVTPLGNVAMTWDKK